MRGKDPITRSGLKKKYTKKEKLGYEAPQHCCDRLSSYQSIAAPIRFTFDNVNLPPETSEQNLQRREQKEKSLRSRIQQLAKTQPFIDTEDFCKLLGIDYESNRAYVRKERYIKAEAPP